MVVLLPALKEYDWQTERQTDEQESSWGNYASKREDTCELSKLSGYCLRHEATSTDYGVRLFLCPFSLSVRRVPFVPRSTWLFQSILLQVKNVSRRTYFYAYSLLNGIGILLKKRIVKNVSAEYSRHFCFKIYLYRPDITAYAASKTTAAGENHCWQQPLRLSP